MFGHQDDDKDQDKKDGPHDEDANTAAGPADQNGTDAPADAPGGNADDTGDDGHAGGPVDDEHAWQHPGEHPDDDGKKDEAVPDEPAQEEPEAPDEPALSDDQPGPISDVIAPAGSGSAQHPVPPMPINARDLPDDDARTPHELIEIKQKALNELQPLLGQLDQSPEDKFRTLMMIIQASDNQDMVKQAYDVAENIKDEKVRAQALLDIVNEINYFTQHPAG